MFINIDGTGRDETSATQKLLEQELEGFGIRLNKSPPNIVFKRKEKGGLNLTCLVSHSIRC